jgi:hypothetical protein
MSDPIPSFDYFVVRLNRTESSTDRITGLVERLGSGEKQPFATAEHLVRLLSSWTPSGYGEAPGWFARTPEVRGG